MKATAQVQKLKSENCKSTIIRNLSRIMDIRIVDIDVERKTLSLVYDTILAFEKAKRELIRIGYPMEGCKHFSFISPKSQQGNRGYYIHI